MVAAISYNGTIIASVLFTFTLNLDVQHVTGYSISNRQLFHTGPEIQSSVGKYCKM